MAEFAVVIVEKVSEKLIDLIIHQFSYLFFYKRNIKRLTNGVEDLQGKKNDVESSVATHNRNLDIIGKDVLNWLDEVEKNEKMADEILERTKIVEAGCLYGWCPSLKQRYIVSRKAVIQMEDVKELQRKRGTLTLIANRGDPSGLDPEHVPIRPGVFGSRISMTKNVIKALKDESIVMIGICGMGGLGKTKMADEIRHRALADDISDGVAMATVSENPDLKRIQNELAEPLGLKLEEHTIVKVRGEKLCKRLKGKRTLIILDDVWDNLNLEELGIPIGDHYESKGCKVLITSRDKNTCTTMGAKDLFEVELLPNREAWDLFKEKAAIGQETGELCDIAKKVSEECGGLPLAIVTVGSALKGKGERQWQAALDELKCTGTISVMDKVYARLRLSYNLLESNVLRRLFLRCCTYPEDFDIPEEELVRYSVGLRLFKDLPRLEYVRGKVNMLVDQLKSCYLLLVSNKTRHVKVHDVLRDFGLKEASHGEHVFLVGDPAKLERYIQDDSVKGCTEISVRSCQEIALPPGLDCPVLQCLTFSTRGSIQYSANYFGGMKKLRFVSFCGQSISTNSEEMFLESPQTPLECFMNVRTLCLEDCVFNTDIRFIGSLQNLEILSFRGSSEIDVLPNELGQLGNLKLLDLRRCNIGLIMPGVLSSLKKLEDLYMGNYFSGREAE